MGRSFAFAYIHQFIVRVTVGRILVAIGNIVVDNQRVKLTQDRHTANLQVNTLIIQAEKGLTNALPAADTKSVGSLIKAFCEQLDLGRGHLVAHDIGAWVAVAFLAVRKRDTGRICVKESLFWKAAQMLLGVFLISGRMISTAW
jgi:chorismate synthase